MPGVNSSVERRRKGIRFPFRCIVSVGLVSWGESGASIAGAGNAKSCFLSSERSLNGLYAGGVGTKLPYCRSLPSLCSASASFALLPTAIGSDRGTDDSSPYFGLLAGAGPGIEYGWSKVRSY